MASLAASGIVSTPDNQHQGRRAYHALDAWRGVASLWVVLYHASLSLPVLFPMRPIHSPAWVQGGYLGVPLFFVISGYCIANAAISAARRDQAAHSFFMARLRRIYPPYLFVLLLSVVVSRLLPHFQDAFSLAPLFFASSLTLTQVPLHQALAQSVFWTLNFEVGFYVCVGALLFLPPPLRTPRTILNMLHALTLFATALLIFLPKAPGFPLSFWTQFGLGVLAFDILRHPLARFPRLALLVTGIGLVVFALTHRYGNEFVLAAPPMRIGFFVSLGFALLLIALYKFDKQAESLPLARFFAWLGGFSYSLYLVHPLAIGAVLHVARALGLSFKSAAFCVVTEVVVSLICARVLFLCCERPFLSLSKPKSGLPKAGLKCV